jgi:hypothetical protein
MSDHLVCARCAAPVAEGRCPVCRAARNRLGHATWLTAPVLAALMAALVAAIALVTLLVVATQRYVLAY